MQLLFLLVFVFVCHWSARVGVLAALGGARRLRQASSAGVRVAEFSNLPLNLTERTYFTLREVRLFGEVNLLESSPDDLPAPYGAIALGRAQVQQLAQLVQDEMALVPPAAAAVSPIIEFPGVALRGQSVLDTLGAQQPLRIPTVFAPFHAGTTFRVAARNSPPGVTLNFSNMTLLLPNVTYDSITDSGFMDFFDLGMSGRFCFTNSVLALKSCEGYIPNTYHMWCCTDRQCNILYTQQAIEDLGYDTIDNLEYIRCYGAEQEVITADEAGTAGPAERSTDGAKRAALGGGIAVLLLLAAFCTTAACLKWRWRTRREDQVPTGGVPALKAAGGEGYERKSRGEADSPRAGPFVPSSGRRTDVDGVTTSMGVVTDVYDTAVAAAETTNAQLKARLAAELDHMRHRGELFLGQFAVLPWTQRREGGQGVVQFMRSTRTEEAVAVKFFLSRSAFSTEIRLYGEAVLRSMMPAVRLEVGNVDGAERNSRGYPWPPCIVLEKGESLQEWKAKTQPAFSTILDALCLIAERLAQLHGSGWAHRDMKPGNVLRLPGQHSWTLMDFGCAAVTGLEMPLTYSPSYAPPEVAHAVECGAHTVIADPAADMWAFGVMAFELLTGAPLFEPFTSREAIWAQLCGRGALPWEAGAPGREGKLAQLRVLKSTILHCLQRRPGERPTAPEVVRQLRNLFESYSTFPGRSPRPAADVRVPPALLYI